MQFGNSTPGPWQHNPQNPSRLQGPKDETIGALYGHVVGIDNQFTNARLMAAAPTMYQYLSTQSDDKSTSIIEDISSDTLASSWTRTDDNPRLIKEDSTTLASVFGGIQGELEQRDNARLIVAAPAMRDYVQQKASNGDLEAVEIIALL